MNHGSLFSGIGGFDLAAEWMGWNNVFHCEWNPFGQRILKHYWPNAVSYDDICKTDFTIWRGRVDILTGGFPCQPYSVAGKRKGTEDSRHLWPEMLRAIRECRPTWIVGENVPGIINWNEGLVFEQVCTELEGEGYEVQPVVLPAASKNALHKRDRIWFVAANAATSTGQSWSHLEYKNGCGVSSRIEKIILQQEKYIYNRLSSVPSKNWTTPKEFAWSISEWGFESPFCRRNDGLSQELVDKCLEAYGNAIVPQVAYQIFQAINEMNK